MSKYSNLSNCHLHSLFSSDSEEDICNIIETAIKLDFRYICFTDHNDYDFPEKDEDGKPLFLLDFNKYIDTLEEYREEYAGKLNILIGVEQGLMKSVADRVNEYDPEGRLDFIIGSSHLVNGLDPYYPEFWEGRDSGAVIEDYYKSIIENLSVCSNFDVYGHIDYIARYIVDESFNYSCFNYQDYIDVILKKIIESGKGIEINTAGYRTLGKPNPEEAIIKRYRELGGEIITMGSDAHKAVDLDFNYDKVSEILKRAGFEYYSVYRKRKAEFIKL